MGTSIKNRDLFLESQSILKKNRYVSKEIILNLKTETMLRIMKKFKIIKWMFTV